jgi:hypothetical protein
MGPGCEAEIMRVCPDVFRLVCTVPIIACMVRRTIDELAFRYGVGPRRLFATSSKSYRVITETMQDLLGLPSLA